MKANNPKDLIGAKKPDLTVIPYDSLIGVSVCMQDGAYKYGPFNWREPGKAVGTKTYIGASLRHLFSYLSGENCAPDSGHNHIDHAISGLMVLRDAQINGNCVDDRDLKGSFGRLVEEYFQKSKLGANVHKWKPENE